MFIFPSKQYELLITAGKIINYEWFSSNEIKNKQTKKSIIYNRRITNTNNYFINRFKKFVYFLKTSLRFVIDPVYIKCLKTCRNIKYF